jgi:Chalcone isomerase-like
MRQHSWGSAVLIASVTCLSAAFATVHSALPTPLLDEGFTARRVGAGLLQWFGFDIYEAALWTPDGTFADSYGDEPVAFTLTYRRSFSRDRLIAITRTAWTEFALANEDQQRRWSRQLAMIWVDVRKDSNMTTLVLPAGETRFYNAERLLGRIDDPAFGPAFLRIWLDPSVADTGLGELRAQLINQSPKQRRAR